MRCIVDMCAETKWRLSSKRASGAVKFVSFLLKIMTDLNYHVNMRWLNTAFLITKIFCNSSQIPSTTDTFINFCVVSFFCPMIFVYDWRLYCYLITSSTSGSLLDDCLTNKNNKTISLLCITCDNIVCNAVNMYCRIIRRFWNEKSKWFKIWLIEFSQNIAYEIGFI